MPHGTRTPPKPPSRSPPPASPLPARVRAVTEIVRDMAGKNTQQKLADFDRHYMQDGVPDADVSVKGGR